MNKKLRLPLAAVIAVTAVMIAGFSCCAYAAAEGTVYERVIAHGGGIIEGFETTNSREALENAIKNGYLNVELDFALSSDGKVIACHDWNAQSMSYFGVSSVSKVTAAEYSKLLCFGRFHTLTFDDVAGYLRMNPSLRIVTDTKEDNMSILTVIARDYPDVISQVYPQIYSYNEYDKVYALGYRSIILTLYKMNNVNTNQLLNYVKARPAIYAVTMSVDRKKQPYCKALMNAGYVVYTHTVNDFETAVADRELGSYGVYTDTLLPVDFSEFNMKYFPVVTKNGRNIRLTDAQYEDGYIRLMTTRSTVGEDEFVGYLIDGQRAVLLDWYGNEYRTFPLGMQCRIKPDGLSKGVHTLTIQIYNKDGILQGSRDDYRIFTSNSVNRVVSAVYEYRLGQTQTAKAFEGILADNDPAYNFVLRNSIIFKVGDNAFYYDGYSESFRINGDAAKVRDVWGMAGIPLTPAAEVFGFDSVKMDTLGQIVIDKGGKKTIIRVDGMTADIGGTTLAFDVPVTLFNNRTYVPAKLIGALTGRNVIESGGIAVILPEGVVLNDEESKGILIRGAGQLYSADPAA